MNKYKFLIAVYLVAVPLVAFPGLFSDTPCEKQEKICLENCENYQKDDGGLFSKSSYKACTSECKETKGSCDDAEDEAEDAEDKLKRYYECCSSCGDSNQCTIRCNNIIRDSSFFGTTPPKGADCNPLHRE